MYFTSRSSLGETRPLLRDTEGQDTGTSQETAQTPLPRSQVAVLCYLRTLDPLNFSQIFPYINQFIETLRLTNDPSRVGLYSGLAESAFAISQLLAIYPWAVLSDTIGRRPVVLAGVAGLTITTTMLGLSRDFTGVLLSRALAGLSSGNVSVIPVILCEITDSTNQASAFPLLGIFYPLGAILGSLIGGSFSDPSIFYPQLSHYAEFFKTFPCFLPCLVVALVNFIGFIITYSFLGETYPGKRTTAVKQSYTFKSILSMPIIRSLCMSGCCLGFLATAFDVVLVLFSYSPINTGGLGLQASEIGYALAISSASSVLLQMFFMPVVLRRVNHFKLYHFFMLWWPYVFMGFPILSIIASSNARDVEGQLTASRSPLLWIAIFVVLAMSKMACLAYAVNSLLVKRSSDPGSLGATMGLLQISTCLPRAFSPAFVSSAFAMSLEKNILGGYCWVVVMISLSILSICCSGRVLSDSKMLSDRPSMTK